MTPNEYRTTYKEFMGDDDVYYVSEHRGAFNNSEELSDMTYDEPDIVLFPISITRFASQQAAIELMEEEGIRVAVHHVFRIKPFAPSKEALDALGRAKYGGCVLDDDYVDGVAKSMAFDLMHSTNKKMEVLGLENRTAGFARQVDNLPPQKDQIKKFISTKINEIRKVVE